VWRLSTTQDVGGATVPRSRDLLPHSLGLTDLHEVEVEVQCIFRACPGLLDASQASFQPLDGRNCVTDAGHVRVIGTLVLERDAFSKNSNVLVLRFVTLSDASRNRERHKAWGIGGLIKRRCVVAGW
jgi:hypothetical protein